MYNLKKISEKIVNSRYLSRWLVLGIDSIISMIGTIFVYATLGFFIHSAAPLSTYGYIALTSLLTSILIFLVFSTYRGIVRHTTMYEILRIFFALIAKVSILYLFFLICKIPIGITLNPVKLAITEALDLIVSLFALVTLRVFLIYVYNMFLTSVNRITQRILVYGSDTKSISVANYLSKSMYADCLIIGYVVVDKRISKLKLSGLPVYTIDSYTYFKKIITKNRVNAIIFPDQKLALEEKDRIIDYCLKEHIKVMLLPQLNEVSASNGFIAQIRNIRIEDLLGRDEITINMEEISSFLNDKVVMVTGAAGSIGSDLCRLISTFKIKQLLLLDNAETPLHNIQLELMDREHRLGIYDKNKIYAKYKFILADVRNRVRINSIFDEHKPQIIFHAAAYKHVPMMEANPTESINVNVIGTKVVADAAVRIGVEKMIMISTDKAVNPTNVMGASKRIAELYVQSLSKAIIAHEVAGKTKFITTRFGNVLGSNGSVIPRFREQIMTGGPVTVTHKDIIRYFMTIPEACRLVLEAATMGEGYEIFVFDMGSPVKIADLAKKMIALAGFEPDVDIKIEYIGLRPGEKLFEELLNGEEHSIPTNHKKISIAKVRSCAYSDVERQILLLKEYAKSSNYYETVRMMKAIVPEFKSQNSIYAELDNK